MADLGSVGMCKELVGGMPARVVSGIVVDAEGAAAMAELRLYRRLTGALMGVVFTDAEGKYTIASPDREKPVYLVCQLLSGAENAKIFDNVVPL